MKRDRHFAEVNFIKRRRRDGRSGETGKDDRGLRSPAFAKATARQGDQRSEGKI